MCDNCEPVETGRMEGYLDKKTRLRLWSYWRKYWFVLEGKTLLCFKSQEESDSFFEMKRNTRKAFLSFTNVHAVRPICCNNPARHAFEIITRGPKIYLSANDEETRQKWLEALKNALLLPSVSPPIKKERASVSGMMSLKTAANQSFSLSQPNLHFSDPEFICNEFECWRVQPDIVLDHCVTRDSQTVVLRNKNRHLVVPRAPPPCRNTAVEFFMDERNVNWPGLSLDLCDEVLDELMQIGFDSTDKDTQTDFPDLSDDEQAAYLRQVRTVRNELIAYLSSASLNASIMEEKPIPRLGRSMSDSRASVLERTRLVRNELISNLHAGSCASAVEPLLPDRRTK